MNLYLSIIRIEDKEKVILRVGREILRANYYQRMLRGYEKIKDLDAPPLTISAKQSEAENKKELKFDDTQSLFEFMMAEAKKGVSVQRYKGLGEMNADQLCAITMNPKKRIMLKVNIDDAEKADNIFTPLMEKKLNPEEILFKNMPLRYLHSIIK